MGLLNLPPGADGAFRIEEVIAFGDRFSIHVYGIGRRGWSVATLRHRNLDRVSGVTPLPKGEWATLCHLVDRCGFWSLPATGDLLADPGWEWCDGSDITIAGRVGGRYHRIDRGNDREWGVDAVVRFGRRVSGFFPPPQAMTDRDDVTATDGVTP